MGDRPNYPDRENGTWSTESIAPGDSFVIRSEDEGEVIEHVKQHAREKHDVELGDEDVRGMIEQTS